MRVARNLRFCTPMFTVPSVAEKYLPREEQHDNRNTRRHRACGSASDWLSIILACRLTTRFLCRRVCH